VRFGLGDYTNSKAAELAFHEQIREKARKRINFIIMRIIFMGTPDFAVPSLEVLIKHQYQIVAVITAPDKPAGRGNQLMTSAVKDCALANNIPILQPTNLKDERFLEELRSYQADLQIVVAFRMLPEVVWNMPPKGTFNLHASLLPKYRGAAPINWAIIQGETETGLSTFFLRHEIDTGNIIFQAKEVILPEDNAGTLYEKLRFKGAELVLQTVKAIQSGNYPQIPQDLSQPALPAPKIFRETCEIDWKHKSTQEIHNFVRGLSPYPCAWTTLQEKNCKIFRTNPNIALYPLPEGFEQQKFSDKTYYTDNKNFLLFATADGWIGIEELQLEGKKRLEIKAFLAGNKLE
jgi:methionyl-tRNA formyltransferase